MKQFVIFAVLIAVAAASDRFVQFPMRIPRIGLGCFDPQQGDAGIHMKSGVANYNASQTAPSTYPQGMKIRQLAYEALKRGYRAFDGGEEYGNDAAIGGAIKQALKDGIISSLYDVFVTSKLANTRMGGDDVEPNLRQTNEEFGINGIDLFLIHHPYPMSYQRKDFIQSLDYLDTWKYMIKAHKKGLARHVGVANFNASMLQRLIDESEMVPHAIQLETHPYHPNNDVLAICEKYNITLIAYAPLGTPWHARETNRTPMLEDPLLSELGKKYKASPAQIVIKWHMQRSHLTAVVPHTENYAHLEENINVDYFTLSNEDMARINALEKPGLQGRFWQFIEHRPAKYFPYELE